MNSYVSGTINGTAVSNNHRAFARTIKFDDTNFTNPQRVGVIGAFTGAAGYGNSPTVLSNDLDLYANSINVSYPKYSPDVELNADGSRMALSYMDYDQGGDAIHLISFSDTNFSSPSLTGRIGGDYTGAKDLDLSSDAAISQNRILSGQVGFGWDIELSSDATKLVALYNSKNESSSFGRHKSIHLFTFSDGNFSNPTYVGAITSDDDISTSYQTGSKTDTGYTYNNNKILEDFDWGQYGEYGCYRYSCSHAEIGRITSSSYGSSIHQIKIALSGDGTRLVVSGRGFDDDSGLYLIGFSDSNFGNPEVKQIINPGIFKTSDSTYQDQYVGGSMSMDDTGKLLVIGTPGDNGFNNDGNDYGATLLLKENILSGGYSYTDSSSDDVIINTTELKNLLDANVNVTLQANSDITVNSAITTTGTGTLSLHAGRDVDINKSISTSGNLAIIASDTSSNNVVSAQRDSGTGDILAAYESDGTTAISLTASDLDITLNNGSGVTNASMGDIELATITATTGTLQSANFSGSGAAVSDKIYDGDTSATVTTTGSVSGLTLVGSDLSLVNTASFTSATVGSAKDATVDYDLSGYLSGNIDASNTSGTAITESVTADITSASSSNDSSETENIVAENTNDPSQSNVENMIGDVNKIIAFVSVDAIVGSTMSLQLATESTIRSISPTEELGIQSL